MKDDRERLRHIIGAMSRIEKYARSGEEVFRRDELIQNWMVRHLQIIGEAARALSPSLRARYPEIPWSDIIGMRHVLVHDYFGIDLDIVWRVISADIPRLKERIESIVSGLDEGP
ncbi:MAG: DUF86 domain-containing protein [Deltaproteobacteria bacterium]|nr:DUF86 domain-containing protein [Deltaproteobacteria bacterium]